MDIFKGVAVAKPTVKPKVKSPSQVINFTASCAPPTPCDTPDESIKGMHQHAFVFC